MISKIKNYCKELYRIFRDESGWVDEGIDEDREPNWLPYEPVKPNWEEINRRINNPTLWEKAIYWFYAPYRFVRWKEWLGIFNWVERHLYGAGTIDIIDYDHFLAKKLSKDLQKLKDRTDTYPEELTEKEWDVILSRLIVGFQKIATGHEEYEYKDYEYEEWLAWRKRIMLEDQETLELFSKYYFNLWY